MPGDFTALSGILYCPDDGELLTCAPFQIDCHLCGRRFPVFENGIAELLPRRPIAFSSDSAAKYWRAYLRAYEQPFEPDENVIAWGAPEANPESWVQRRLCQIRAVEPLIDSSDSSGQQVLCDIAAGAGYYTLAYSSRFRIVLHCDLSVDNLNYAARKAQALGLRNIFFLRTDYFCMPLRNSVDRILCVDTLIRGEDHEIAVLKSIRASLAPNGRAVVDFHNWWHNPIRRLGLLPENFTGNRSYRLKETKRLLREAGITKFEAFRFHQEFESDSDYRTLLSKLLPATRLLFRFPGGQPCAS